MHNILTKKLGEMCDICRCGDIFLIVRDISKVISPCGTTLLLHLNILLSNYQSNCSILSRDHKFI